MTPHSKASRLLLAVFGLLLSTAATADTFSATAAMEDPTNPLVQIMTSQGDIFVELFEREAPDNVANILALARGEVELVNAESGQTLRTPFYDGTRFHRVIPGFVIQAGSPLRHPLGAPRGQLRDEINADFLGLQDQPLVNPDGSFNALMDITSQEVFAEEILRPLYARMDIEDASELARRQFDVLERIQGMTVKRALENQGYRFRATGPSRTIERGVMALASSGPDTNGPEFFIAMADLPWLTGRHTVVGKVVEGINVVDNIGRFPIDAARPSRFSAVIYSMQRVN